MPEIFWIEYDTETAKRGIESVTPAAAACGNAAFPETVKKRIFVPSAGTAAGESLKKIRRRPV